MRDRTMRVDVGLRFVPPRSVSTGDSVGVEIDGIGVLINQVVAA